MEKKKKLKNKYLIIGFPFVLLSKPSQARNQKYNMICLLCLEQSESPIKIESDKKASLDISSILEKYFRFCFDVSNPD